MLIDRAAVDDDSLDCHAASVNQSTCAVHASPGSGGGGGGESLLTFSRSPCAAAAAAAAAAAGRFVVIY